MVERDAIEGARPEGGRFLPPEVLRLGWISFLLDVASEVVYPLIPLFLTSVLGAPALALGAIEGVAQGLLSAVTAFSGWSSDRLRRRVPFIRAGYGLAAFSKPMLALATTWPAVLFLRALDRLGKGIRTAARDALIADLAGPARSGTAFGFHRAMDTAGALCGVLLAIGLLELLPGRYRLIFALTAIPGAAAVALAFTIRERAPAPRPGGQPVPRLLAVARHLPRSWWRAALPLWLFALGNSSDAFLLLRASERGLADTSVVWLYALFNLVYSATSLPAGILSDRLGRPRVIALGWVLYAAVYAGFAALGRADLWWLFALYGLHMGLTQGVARAWVADLAPPDLRGTALGVYQLGLGLALLASSLVAGWLWDAVAPAAPFAFGSGVALAALALLLPLARGPGGARQRP